MFGRHDSLFTSAVLIKAYGTNVLKGGGFPILVFPAYFKQHIFIRISLNSDFRKGYA